MADPVDPIVRFVHALYEACEQSREAFAARINPGDLENALADILGLEDHVRLLDREWTPAEMLAQVADYDFSRLYPVLLQTVTLESSIVPEGILAALLNRQSRQPGRSGACIRATTNSRVLRTLIVTKRGFASISPTVRSIAARALSERFRPRIYVVSEERSPPASYRRSRKPNSSSQWTTFAAELDYRQVRRGRARGARSALYASRPAPANS